MSSAVSTIFAPSLRRAWPPRFRPLKTLPGTAMTSRPCSSAHPAVMSDPDFSEASITTTASESPLIRRFLSGKWCGSGGVPGGYSLTTSPASAICAASGLCSGGIDAVHARAKHRDGSTSRERAAMRSGIDAARQATHDCHATRCQITRKPRRGIHGHGACRPRSDDRNHRDIERREIAAIPDHRRTVGDGHEQ